MIVYEEIYKKYGLSPTQQEIIKIIGQGKKVLEIGSSTGYMTKAFLENGCVVDIVEQNKEAASKVTKKVRKVFNQSIEDNGIYKLLKRDYDFVVMADVLEHLIKPEEVLKKILKIVSNNTKLLISLPNVACWAMRKQLFFKGDFEYQESGLLDKTHLHFYTVNTLPKILTASGWEVEQIIGTMTRLPLEGFIIKIPILRYIFQKIFYQNLINKFKNLSYYHILAIASKK